MEQGTFEKTLKTYIGEVCFPNVEMRVTLPATSHAQVIMILHTALLTFVGAATSSISLELHITLHDCLLCPHCR